MKYLILLIALALSIAMARVSFAKDKPKEEAVSVGQFMEIVAKIARGADIESQDSKNVHVIVKPARIIFSISF